MVDKIGKLLIVFAVLYFTWQLGRFYGRQERIHINATLLEISASVPDYNQYLLTKCLQGKLK